MPRKEFYYQINAFELSVLNIKFESGTALQSIFRLLVEIKAYYFDIIFKGFPTIFSKEIAINIITKYFSISSYMNSLINLSDKTEKCFNSLNNMINFDNNTDNYTKLYNSDDNRYTNLIDVKMESMKFVTEISNLIKIIHDPDSLDNTETIENCYQTISNVFYKYKSFKQENTFHYSQPKSYISNEVIEDSNVKVVNDGVITY